MVVSLPVSTIVSTAQQTDLICMIPATLNTSVLTGIAPTHSFSICPTILLPC
jgi:hypothetical protein